MSHVQNLHQYSVPCVSAFVYCHKQKQYEHSSNML